MRLQTVASALLFAAAPIAMADNQLPSIGHETVIVPSGARRLKAFLWTPPRTGPFPAVLFNHGSGGADAAHTAGLPITEAAEKLAPLFLKHGYAFLYLFRRGQGLSADQGSFMQDILQREERTKGKDVRQHLQFSLLTTDHLDDVTSALSFLKTAPAIDARRIAIAGHSFRGQVTLLGSERDNTLRAASALAPCRRPKNPCHPRCQRLRKRNEQIIRKLPRAGTGGRISSREAGWRFALPLGDRTARARE